VKVEAFYSSLGLQLTKAGNRWNCRCPFHREEKPSFVVYPDGSYHCFGCNAHGTAKDIQEFFGVAYKPFPDITTARDPLIVKLNEIKSKLEEDLVLLVMELNHKRKFKAYDLFDALMMDAYALISNVETSLLDLTSFTKRGYE
jgi:hypothetical protein